MKITLTEPKHTLGTHLYPTLIVIPIKSMFVNNLGIELAVLFKLISDYLGSGRSGYD